MLVTEIGAISTVTSTLIRLFSVHLRAIFLFRCGSSPTEKFNAKHFHIDMITARKSAWWDYRLLSFWRVVDALVKNIGSPCDCDSRLEIISCNLCEIDLLLRLWSIWYYTVHGFDVLCWCEEKQTKMGTWKLVLRTSIATNGAPCGNLVALSCLRC